MLSLTTGSCNHTFAATNIYSSSFRNAQAYRPIKRHLYLCFALESSKDIAIADGEIDARYISTLRHRTVTKHIIFPECSYLELSMATRVGCEDGHTVRLISDL